MTTETAALKPCPFCGGEDARLRKSPIHGYSWVSCTQCGLECPTETGITSADAIDYWNTRAALSPEPAQDGTRYPYEARYAYIKPVQLPLSCKDGGKCHHQCTTECFRESCCVPLSGSGLNDDWTPKTEPAQDVGAVYWRFRFIGTEDWIYQKVYPSASNAKIEREPLYGPETINKLKAERDAQYDEKVKRIAAEGAAILRYEKAEASLAEMQSDVKVEKMVNSSLRVAISDIRDQLTACQKREAGLRENYATGEAYEMGRWSRRNIEAFWEDQDAALNKEGA